MKEETYESKLNKFWTAPHLRSSQKLRKKPTLIVQDSRNKKLKKMLDDGMLDEKLYKKLKSTCAQPAWLYGLAKVQNIPLRPLLSLPLSSYV